MAAPPVPEPIDEPSEPSDFEPCGHALTGDPATVVIQAYLHDKDCLGEAPSQRSLARDYGLHRTKVAALVGHLNGSPD